MRNFTPFKGRSIDSNKKVKVYRNLNNGKISIQQSGLIVGHCDKIILQSCEFIVNQSGRLRVVNEKRKNVHAFITGYVSGNLEISSKRLPVTYNPYRFDSFVMVDSTKPVKKATMASVSSNGWIFVDGNFGYCG